MARSKKTCSECGALVNAGSSTCDLCGSNVEEASKDVAAGIESSDAAQADDLFCNDCGWRNPAGSRFCAGCGKVLQAVTEGARPALPPTDEPELSEPTSTSTDPSDVGKQVTLLVGGGVLIILALYIITLVSKQNVSTGGADVPSTTLSAMAVLEDANAEPPPAEIQAAADELRGRMEQVPLDERRTLQTQLVDLFYEAGLPDYAAVEARAVAEETGHPDDWRDAGDLFFHWMETVNPVQRAEIATLTIDAYERVLEHTPENHDVRANMAWALQYDASDPMRAIDETNYILDRDENHLQAIFNRGYFLMRINRFDQAVEQFERVRELGDADTPIVQQATAVIAMIQEQQSD